MATVIQTYKSQHFSNVPRNLTSDLERNRIISLLKMCRNMVEIHQVHATLIKTGLMHEISAVNAIIEISITQNLLYAQSVFERAQNPTTFSKNLMIRGHSQSKFPRSAITFYIQILVKRFELNKFAISFLIQACSRSRSVKEGKQIHAQIVKLGEIDAHLTSSLICFYSEIQDLASARKVFELSRGFLASWNSMIDGYVKCGEIEMAQELFAEMPQRTLIAWTALITGYVHMGRHVEALALFRTVQKLGFNPDERILVSILPSISRLGALSLGKWVHSFVENSGMEMDVFLRSALVDMYSKCGNIESAIELFEEVGPTKRNVVMWNSLIGGLAMHGRGRDVVEMFQMMLASGARPTDVTFVGLLRGCSHAGLVDEGLNYFAAMRDEYGIEPTIEHYGCMVDLLGRAGRLEEAEKLMERSAKGPPDVVLLKTLLGACRVHGNVKMGERIGDKLIELASDDSSCYVLLANLYASVGRWEDVSDVRNVMKERGVKKIAGCSSIELGNMVHEFFAGDMSHPQIKEIYSKLDEMRHKLKAKGYVFDTSQVLIDTNEKGKEAALLRHSEKLAIAFGLIQTTPGSTICIVKNLRVCPDCHSVTKLVSQLYDREIIVRDQNRFHHFKNGVCSCNDYW